MTDFTGSQRKREQRQIGARHLHRMVEGSGLLQHATCRQGFVTTQIRHLLGHCAVSPFLLAKCLTCCFLPPGGADFGFFSSLPSNACLFCMVCHLGLVIEMVYLSSLSLFPCCSSSPLRICFMLFFPACHSSPLEKGSVRAVSGPDGSPRTAV